MVRMVRQNICEMDFPFRGKSENFVNSQGNVGKSKRNLKSTGNS